MNLENSFQKRYSIITNLKLEQFLWIKSKKLDVEVNPYFASVLIIYTQRYNTTTNGPVFHCQPRRKHTSISVNTVKRVSKLRQ